MMEISLDKQAGCMVISLKGRLDADGAHVLTSCFDHITVKDEKYLVIDMSSVPYISSGGIRALHAEYKNRKNHNGQIILAGTGEFAKKVLEMSGFSRIFPQFATSEHAIQSINELSLAGPVSTEWKVFQGLQESSMDIGYHPLSEGSALLVSYGPWKEFFQSGLKTEDLQSSQFRHGEYSIGIGVFGPSSAECVNLTGDMVTAGRMIAWTPPGRCTADYVLPTAGASSGQPEPGGIPEIPGVFSACSFHLEGDSHEVFTVKPGSGPDAEITLGDLYAILCTHAKNRGDRYNGIMAVKILAQVSEIETITLAKSPIEQNRPKDREPIWSVNNYHEWFKKSRIEIGGDVTLVSFGVVYDPSVRTSPDHEIITTFFPMNFPADGQAMFSHTLGITFKPFNWEQDDTIDLAIGKVESEGEVTGMYRVASRTRIRRALVGISYIDSLRCDDGPEIELNEPCPEWTSAYAAITRQLHRGSKRVSLSRISGGFSGSLVFRSSVIDRADRKQMPFVLKLGRWSIISDEVRGYTDHVERYILNSSTRLIQHKKIGESGGILYNFVGIGGPASTLVSFEDYYHSHSPKENEVAIDQLFRIVLSTWYGQPVRRDFALYQEYQRPPLYEKSREYAQSHFGVTPNDPEITLPCDLGKSTNPLYFIEHIIQSRLSSTVPVYIAPQHGDLNLKNILLDQDGHMWLIDFSDTRVTHNLRDIAKMETVIRTEMLSFTSDEEVCRMAGWDERFIAFKNLHDLPGIPGPGLPEEQEKAFRFLQKLRYYADLVTILDDHPDQYLLPLLWYTIPVLWYTSVGEFGKKYAWITASRICEHLLNNQSGKML